MCLWEVIDTLHGWQWLPVLSTQETPVPQKGATAGMLLVRAAYASHWSFTKPRPSLALTEAFLLSASAITVRSQLREMPFLSQHCPRPLCYHRHFHAFTIYWNQSLLTSPLLKTLALVQWQRWPNVPLSLTKLCTGFFFFFFSDYKPLTSLFLQYLLQKNCYCKLFLSYFEMHVNLLTSCMFYNRVTIFLKDLGTIPLKCKQWRRWYPCLPKSVGEEEPNLNGCQWRRKPLAKSGITQCAQRVSLIGLPANAHQCFSSSSPHCSENSPTFYLSLVAFRLPLLLE